MIRLLFWLLLIYFGYRIVLALTSGPKRPPVANRSDESVATTTHRDPVCGVYVAEEDAVIGRHKEQRLYFCSRDCLEKYCEQLDHTTN